MYEEEKTIEETLTVLIEYFERSLCHAATSGKIES